MRKTYSNVTRYLPLVVAFVLAAGLQADVRLPALISDHMVLEQGVPVRIWGWADSGETVTVEFHGQKVSAKAGDAGKWAVYLKPLDMTAPADMRIAGKNEITIKDVLAGEVWIGSGQSNMQWNVGRAVNAEQEMAQANYPLIRIFDVKRTVAESPAEDVTGAWRVCSPDSVKDTSAVGYFFSRELYKARRVPVGFIHSSWGGTPAQAWTSRPALDSEQALKFIADDWQNALAKFPEAKEKYARDLAEWKQAAAKAQAAGQTPPRQPPEPREPAGQNGPSGLYNAMVAPLTPYAIRGVIWYQGESNASASHAFAYRRLFRLMIENWRQDWGQGPFPFLFVQLANFKANPYWPLLRESQTETLNLVNTGMAVTIDIGESTDIHPKNKQEVGRRLALAARAGVYGEPVEYSGPVYRQMSVEGNKVRLWFDHARGGLELRGGGPLTGFIVSGADGAFVPADAQVEGSTVVVSSPSITEPAAVRYAWADDPIANLTNRDGLPASPFRTDRWPEPRQ